MYFTILYIRICFKSILQSELKCYHFYCNIESKGFTAKRKKIPEQLPLSAFHPKVSWHLPGPEQYFCSCCLARIRQTIEDNQQF